MKLGDKRFKAQVPERPLWLQNSLVASRTCNYNALLHNLFTCTLNSKEFGQKSVVARIQDNHFAGFTTTPAQHVILNMPNLGFNQTARVQKHHSTATDEPVEVISKQDVICDIRPSEVLHQDASTGTAEPHVSSGFEPKAPVLRGQEVTFCKDKKKSEDPLTKLGQSCA